MTWRLRFSLDARLDIERVLDWTLARYGVDKHNEYSDLIRQALEQIAEEPFDFRSKARPDLHENARTFHIGTRGKGARHLFVYLPSTGGKILVSRFLHDSMDLKRHLPPGFGDESLS